MDWPLSGGLGWRASGAHLALHPHPQEVHTQLGPTGHGGGGQWAQAVDQGLSRKVHDSLPRQPAGSPGVWQKAVCMV